MATKTKSKDTKKKIPASPSKKTSKAVSGKRSKKLASVKPEIVKDDEIETLLSDEVADAKKLVPATEPRATLDALQKYLVDIRKYPLLTPEQERKLAIKYKETGDKTAAEQLVTANLRFVVKIAAEYSRFGARMIDLIQEGNVGLMHAVREFNPYKGVKLITYAVWWIRGYIQEYLMKNYSQVKIGTTQAQKKLFYHLNKEKAKLDALGEAATPKLLSAKLGVTEDEVKEMESRLGGRDLSLDAPVSPDESSAQRWVENQTDGNAESVDDQIALGEEKKIFHREIKHVEAQLNDKEKYILHNRILGDPPLTLQEVGNHFKITRERARQLEERVIDKIKIHFKQVFPDYQIQLPEE